MKLHLPHLLRRAVLRAVFAAASVVTTLASASYADMITPDGRTATSVIQNGSVYNVYTNTVRGNTGFNSFSTFDVYAETTANLHLAGGTDNLVNVVRDKCSYIDGVLNGYKDGQIGGNIFFLNPNGIVVSKSGVINVGSISMSTPTAAFVEQLIARDGSISPTATKAVLDGDLPINEKGLISVKGKVNAAEKARFQAGKVEVSGEVHTNVAFKELVNTGDETVRSSAGMSISGGKISSGKKTTKTTKKAKKTRATAKKATKQNADIAIFADDVFMDGAVLDGQSVYIDPDKAELSDVVLLTPDYTLEARVIILNNITVGEEGLTSFTLNAANELSDGTWAGNVSITLANCNIVADTVSLSASATTNEADATITISSSAIKAALESGAELTLTATSTSGNASVNVDATSSLESAGSFTAAVGATAGNASLTLDKGSQVKAVTVKAEVQANTGDALIDSNAAITATGDVSLTAQSGWVSSSEDETSGETTYTPNGSGNATLKSGGTITTEGNVTLTAMAAGTSGDAAMEVTGSVKATGTDTREIGEVLLERNESETILDTDTDEQINAKNQAYLERYNTYLSSLNTGTGATSRIDLTSSSSAGAAKLGVNADDLTASYGININATAATDADLQLSGKNITAGVISAVAEGKTATLKVAKDSTLTSTAYVTFTEDGTEVSLTPSDGAISLSAQSSDEDEENQTPAKKDGVLLEVAGALISRRESGTGEAGDITLTSDNKLTVTDTAKLDASSTGGKGGTINLQAFDYSLGDSGKFTVAGDTDDNLGSINVTSTEVTKLTGEVSSDSLKVSDSFLSSITTTTEGSSLGKEWKGKQLQVELSGDVVLTGDLTIYDAVPTIKANTHIIGNGYSLVYKDLSMASNLLSVFSKSSIGDNVTIEGVKDFSITNTASMNVGELIAGLPLTSGMSLEVGKNFTVTASGDVTISLTGLGNTYIEFGEGVNITAGGKVTITATNSNGWGFNFFSKNIKVDVLSKALGSFDNPWLKSIGSTGLIQLDAGGFAVDLFKYLWSGEVPEHSNNWAENKKAPIPQIGFRIARASVTFNDGAANSITASGDISISASSNASVTGTMIATGGGGASISVGFVYNHCAVTLGNETTLTSRSGSISVASSTTSANTLTMDSIKGKPFGISVAVTYDENLLTIGAGSTLKANKDISVTGTSTLDTSPTLIVGRDATREYSESIYGTIPENETEYSPNAVVVGVNVLVHSNESTIDGHLISETGNITCSNTDDITAELYTSGSVSYTYAKTQEDQEDEDNSNWFWKIVKNNLTFNLFGLGEYNFKTGFSSSVDWSGFKSMFSKVSDMKSSLDLDKFSSKDNKESVALTFATNVVYTDNKLVFNGTAEALKGSVTLGSDSSIEAGVSAETKILGVPATTAVAGSLAIPVIINSTTTEVGSTAKVTAAKDITVKSATTLPMSLDYMGWRAWAKAIEDGSASEIFSAMMASAQQLGTNPSAGNLGINLSSGNLGLYRALTSTHASTIMEDTGASKGDSTAAGFNLVGDVRLLDTKTIIDDGATLTAGETLDITSLTKGLQISFVGESPFALTISNRNYVSSKSATSSVGASALVAYKKTNTVTYIGDANLTAGNLTVDSNADITAVAIGLAASVSSGSDSAFEGGVNIIIEDKMTVSEISSGADITLSSGDSHLNAADDSILVNVTGMEADGKKTAIGVGVSLTLDYAYTAALLGNVAALPESVQSAWDSISDGYSMPYARTGAITLSTEGAKSLAVNAANNTAIYSVGIAGSIGTGGESTAFGAANVSIIYNDTDTDARQYGVNGTTGSTAVTTDAENNQKVVNIAGDISVNAGEKAKFEGAGALSVNRQTMNTEATVTDSNYIGTGAFTINAKNTAAIYAVDVACTVGGATVDIAAGSAWNSMSGNTSAELIGGSVQCGSLSIDALTDMNSLSVTLGAAINIELNSGKSNNSQDSSIEDEINQLGDSSSLGDLFSDDDDGNSQINSDILNQGAVENLDAMSLSESSMPLLGSGSSSGSFTLGASIARNYVEMNTTALLEGSSVTSAGALSVTAGDESVITAIGVGVGGTSSSSSVAAGGVFSFAPVTSTTRAIIRQAQGTSTPLDITSGSLTLHATDKHRERVWSFGVGGSESTAGIGLVLAWGSFAGTSTKALMENVNATVTGAGRTSGTTDVDILASSELDATYISVGASGAEKAGITGMVNYLNFNNSVGATVKGSTITVRPSDGAVKVLSQSSRSFTDGVGALSVASSGSSVGAALSFIYLGGNGDDDACTTLTEVADSHFINGGATDILAKNTTKGVLASVNASMAGGSGVSAAGSFAWLTDYSVTAADVVNTTFDKGEQAADAAHVTIDADSTGDLAAWLGTLGIKFGSGAGIGAAALVMKDYATTRATMRGGSVTGTRDLTVHAQGKSDLQGLMIGAAGSSTAGISGGVMIGYVSHDVDATVSDAALTLSGKLAIDAENTSNIGKEGTRFTLANAGIAGEGGVGVAVSLIDIQDDVAANANNLCSTSGSMEVLATENNYADAIVVNIGGGSCIGGTVDVGIPTLRGIATASITADKTSLDSTHAVGITTQGDADVLATNNQELNNIVVTLAAAGSGSAVNLNVNLMHMTGATNATISGNMPLTIGGRLRVLADTNREASYTTVAVAAASAAVVFDLNQLEISDSTEMNQLGVTDEDDKKKNKETLSKGYSSIDNTLSGAAGLLTQTDIDTDCSGRADSSGSSLTAGTAASYSIALAQQEEAYSSPETKVSIDLKGNTATVGSLLADSTDDITTTPVVVGVSGSLYCSVGIHVTFTDIASKTGVDIENTTLNAQNGISVNAKQTDADKYVLTAVSLAGYFAGTGSYYGWTDTSDTYVTLGSNSKLHSTAGAISLNSGSSISENFTHVTVDGSLVAATLAVPCFTSDASTELNVGDNASIISEQGDVDLKTDSSLSLDASLVDVAGGLVSFSVLPTDYELKARQNMTLGNSVTLQGASVALQQLLNHNISIDLVHVGVVVSFGVPVMSVEDTIDSAITIGNDALITATEGDITMQTDETVNRELYLYGGVFGLGGSNTNFNHSTLTHNNAIRVGDNARLRAEEGNITLAAESTDNSSLHTTNSSVTALTVADIAKTGNTAVLNTSVEVGNGVDIKGRKLTLKTENVSKQKYEAPKVSVSLVINPASCSSGYNNVDATSTITLGGGSIDVEDFVTQALNDVNIDQTNLIAGASITYDDNRGEVDSTVNETATVTLGTGDNVLTILTDNTDADANNKYYYKSSDASGNVHGTGVGVVADTTSGTADTTQTLNSAVTLGKGAAITRRKDVAHYADHNNYHTHLAATNDVYSYMTVDVVSGGVVAVATATTFDVTNANTTLNILGSIDAWGDTELTAYSHVWQHVNSSASAGGIVPPRDAWVKNTAKVADSVTITGNITTVGSLAINAGSAAGYITLADGTTVKPGRDDSVTTISTWGEDDLEQWQTREDSLTLSGFVQAGGTIGIYNDPSANTSVKAFVLGAKDANARTDGASAVTSNLSMGGHVTAGLAGYLRVYFVGSGTESKGTCTTAMDLFDGGTNNGDGTWSYSFDQDGGLYSATDSELMVKALSIGGTAVTVVTKADLFTEDFFRNSATTVRDHSIDLYFSHSCPANVIVDGMSITDATEGLWLNGKQIDNADYISLPALYRESGVSIRCDAQGNEGTLTLQGTYYLPKNELYVRSEGNLSAVGVFNCGNVDFAAKGNFTMQSSTNFYMTSPAELYKKLYEELAANERKHRDEVDGYVYGVETPSGYSGTYYNGDTEYPIFNTETYTQTFTNAQLIAAEDKSLIGSITATGSITITGSSSSVIDINGHLNAGVYEVNLPETLKLTKYDGTLISTSDAEALYKADSTNREFTIDGIDGISAYYDAATKRIVITGVRNQVKGDTVGITIHGNIVNSDASGTADIQIATGYRSLTFDNKTGYELELGNIDLSGYRDAALTLENTFTGKTTVYNFANSGSSTTVDLGTSMKAVVSRTTVTRITETGRLTFAGKYEGEDPVNRSGSYNDLFGSKSPMVDSITADTKGADTDVDYTISYTSSGNDVNTFVTTYSKGAMTCTSFADPGTTYRYVYSLNYDETKTDTMTVSANNGLKLTFVGSEGGSSLTVNSDSVYVSGIVVADIATITAAGSITCSEAGMLHATQLNLTAGGALGSSDAAINVDNSVVNAIGLTPSSSFTAGTSLWVDSVSSLTNTHFSAAQTAQITAVGDISTDGKQANSAKYMQISSTKGSVTLTDGSEKGSFTPGVVTITAEDDITLKTSNSLVINSIVSSGGDVSVTADGGISAYNILDTSSFESSFGESAGTTLRSQADAAAEAYYEIFRERLSELTRLYYTQDEEGNYTYRDENGYLKLSTYDSDIAAMGQLLYDAYQDGYGQQIAEFIYDFSGTSTVKGTTFANIDEAGVYLAENASKKNMNAYAKAYYHSLMIDLTTDILRNGQEQGAGVDYGRFNETIYRLYWEKDANGKLVNQTADGSFISPTITKDDGSVITLYSEETCAAITKQFKDSNPAAAYLASESNPILKSISYQLSGYTEMCDVLERGESELGSLAQGIAVSSVPTTISAKGKLTLSTKGIVGDTTFCFTITPESYDADGKPVYSSWAQSFIDEVDQRKRIGTTLLSYDETTGHRTYSIADATMTVNTISALDLMLLRQAAASDLAVTNNTWTVATCGYLGVSAESIAVTASRAYLTTDRDVSLENVKATELRLSTTGSIAGGKLGSATKLVLHAEGNIGSEDNYLTLSGTPEVNITTTRPVSMTSALRGETETTAATTGNIYIASAAKVKVGNLRGNVVNVQLSKLATLAPVTGSTITGAQVDCTQFNLYGPAAAFNISTAQNLGIRTTGSTEETGGMHLYLTSGTAFTNVSFYAANSAYPFYLCTENGINSIKTLNAYYSGILTLNNDLSITTANFTQNKASVSTNRVETSSGVSTTFAGAVTFDGAADYELLFNGSVSQAAGKTFVIKNTDSDLSFADLTAEDGSVDISANGNISLRETYTTGCDLNLTSSGDAKVDWSTIDGDLNVTSTTGNMQLRLTDAQNITLNAANGDVRLLLGVTAIDKISVTAGNDIISSLAQADTLETTATSGGIYLSGCEVAHVTANGYKGVVVHTNDTGTDTYIGNLQSSNGYVKVLSEGTQTHLTAPISGTYIYLYSTDPFILDSGYSTSASLGLVTKNENADVRAIALTNLDDDFSSVLGIIIGTSADGASDASGSLKDKEDELTSEEPVVVKGGTIYYDINGNPVDTADAYADQFTQQ